MATVVRKKDDDSDVVVCGHCSAHVLFQYDELNWMSDLEPNYGFACPACGKNIYENGKILVN